MCILLAFFSALPVSAQKLQAHKLLCEYASSPIGIDVVRPRFSWQIAADEQNVMQTAYEIRVAENENDVRKGKALVWQTRRVASDASVFVPYNGSSLQSRKKYYWQVRVWDNHGHASPWSKVETWEMGLLQPAEWTANWIQTAEETKGVVSPAPMFRKGFALGKAIKVARLYVTAHGIYEAEINGKRVGDSYFTPGWTSYLKRLQYQTYDITNLLHKGNNAIGVMVGDGWYRGNLEFNNKRNLYGKEVALLAQVEVTYADGSTEVIGTDDTWKASFDGPVRGSDIYNGEIYDARLEKNGWATPSFDDSDWMKVKAVSISKDKLVAPTGPPVRKKETFKAVKFITTPKGETVVDFGQNLVGWVQLKLKGNAGDTITLNHAEVLDKEGNFYTANLRAAKQENKFILKGKGEEEEFFEPHFTFQGFRYVKISGYKGALDTSGIKAVALYSDMAPTGSFATSNPLINQLQHNIQWGQKGNFLDVPTDCPQRDERLGWTADAQVFFNTATYNMDVSGFFAKWLKDLQVDQLENGNVPVVIPNVRDKRFSGSAGWADAATIIPWHFYLAYADKRMLEGQYNSMKAWVEFIRQSSREHLSTVGSAYGDWLFYSLNDDRYGKSALTDRNMIAQVFYASSTQNLINAAKVLGKEEDASFYTSLLKNIRQAFTHEYLTPSGRLVSSSQTAYVLALNFDMLPEELRAQAAKRLVENIREYKDHLTTGFLGTPYLCHVLSRFGYNDVAYTLLLQESYPSWLYPVKMGATTIWERWDGIKPDGSFQNEGMNSFNHYSYGAVGDWMYRVMAGINSDSTYPGYKRMIIAPKPGGGFSFVNAELETQYGKIKSAWRKEKNTFILDVTVPVNTTAILVLPKAASAEITDGKTKILNEARWERTTVGDDVSLKVGSGMYHFEYTLQ